MSEYIERYQFPDLKLGGLVSGEHKYHAKEIAVMDLKALYTTMPDMCVLNKTLRDGLAQFGGMAFILPSLTIGARNIMGPVYDVSLRQYVLPKCVFENFVVALCFVGQQMFLHHMQAPVTALVTNGKNNILYIKVLNATVVFQVFFHQTRRVWVCNLLLGTTLQYQKGDRLLYFIGA